MHERGQPVYSSARPRGFEDPYRFPAPPIASSEQWAQNLAQMDEAHQADIQQAIKEGLELQADVHLYKKVGSKFLGIALQPSSGGQGVRIYEYPPIPANK